MLWELRAEPLSGSPDLVMVEMRQVPGYLDFLAEIMPPDVRQNVYVSGSRGFLCRLMYVETERG